MAICKIGAYFCVIFPLSSMELQQPLQLEAILDMLWEGRITFSWFWVILCWKNARTWLNAE